MKANSVSTRRRFFWQAGAALSAPLAATAAHAPADDGRPALEDRLAALEDERAIRALNWRYAELVSSHAYDALAALYAEPTAARFDERVRRVVPDAFDAADPIEFAAQRSFATTRMPCVVHIETEIGPSCTLVQMARLQGEGMLKTVQRRVLEHTYVKRDGVWKFERSAYRAA